MVHLRRARACRRAGAALLGACILPPAAAVEPPSWLACTGIERDADRLACYDRLARAAGSAAPPVEASAATGQPRAPVIAQPGPRADSSASGAEAAADRLPGSAAGSALERHWELTPATRQRAFALRLHQPNYLLPALYTSSRNLAPFQSLLDASGTRRSFDRTELAFQLSLKTKIAEDVLGSRADLWLGYTQQSWWQAYNGPLSSPFRETNYQPELMLVVPTRYELLGLQGRFVNLGLVHQSNGQGGPLSRSWNRAYVQVGLERGEFSLLVRPWYRLRERAGDDNNPDITDYLGHGDLQAAWRWRGHTFSALARRNFHTRHGALQLSWAFPLAGSLKGYLQVFSGHGASLIDYDYRQTTVGLGFLIDSWR